LGAPPQPERYVDDASDEDQRRLQPILEQLGEGRGRATALGVTPRAAPRTQRETTMTSMLRTLSDAAIAAE
jgi:hypothetical protein